MEMDIPLPEECLQDVELPPVESIPLPPTPNALPSNNSSSGRINLLEKTQARKRLLAFVATRTITAGRLLAIEKKFNLKRTVEVADKGEEHNEIKIIPKEEPVKVASLECKSKESITDPIESAILSNKRVGEHMNHIFIEKETDLGKNVKSEKSNNCVETPIKVEENTKKIDVYQNKQSNLQQNYKEKITEPSTKQSTSKAEGSVKENSLAQEKAPKMERIVKGIIPMLDAKSTTLKLTENTKLPVLQVRPIKIEDCPTKSDVLQEAKHKPGESVKDDIQVFQEKPDSVGVKEDQMNMEKESQSFQCDTETKKHRRYWSRSRSLERQPISIEKNSPTRDHAQPGNQSSSMEKYSNLVERECYIMNEDSRSRSKSMEKESFLNESENCAKRLSPSPTESFEKESSSADQKTIISKKHKHSQKRLKHVHPSVIKAYKNYKTYKKKKHHKSKKKHKKKHSDVEDTNLLENSKHKTSLSSNEDDLAKVKMKDWNEYNTADLDSRQKYYDEVGRYQRFFIANAVQDGQTREYAKDMVGFTTTPPKVSYCVQSPIKNVKKSRNEILNNEKETVKITMLKILSDTGESEVRRPCLFSNLSDGETSDSEDSFRRTWYLKHIKNVELLASTKLLCQATQLVTKSSPVKKENESTNLKSVTDSDTSCVTNSSVNSKLEVSHTVASDLTNESVSSGKDIHVETTYVPIPDEESRTECRTADLDFVYEEFLKAVSGPPKDTSESLLPQFDKVPVPVPAVICNTERKIGTIGLHGVYNDENDFNVDSLENNQSEEKHFKIDESRGSWSGTSSDSNSVEESDLLDNMTHSAQNRKRRIYNLVKEEIAPVKRPNLKMENLICDNEIIYQKYNSSKIEDVLDDFTEKGSNKIGESTLPSAKNSQLEELCSTIQENCVTYSPDKIFVQVHNNPVIASATDIEAGLKQQHVTPFASSWESSTDEELESLEFTISKFPKTIGSLSEESKESEKVEDKTNSLAPLLPMGTLIDLKILNRNKVQQIQLPGFGVDVDQIDEQNVQFNESNDKCSKSLNSHTKDIDLFSGAENIPKEESIPVEASQIVVQKDESNDQAVDYKKEEKRRNSSSTSLSPKRKDREGSRYREKSRRYRDEDRRLDSGRSSRNYSENSQKDRTRNRESPIKDKARHWKRDRKSDSHITQYEDKEHRRNWPNDQGYQKERIRDPDFRETKQDTGYFKNRDRFREDQFNRSSSHERISGYRSPQHSVHLDDMFRICKSSDDHREASGVKNSPDYHYKSVNKINELPVSMDLLSLLPLGLESKQIPQDVGTLKELTQSIENIKEFLSQHSYPPELLNMELSKLYNNVANVAVSQSSSVECVNEATSKQKKSSPHKSQQIISLDITPRMSLDERIELELQRGEGMLQMPSSQVPPLYPLVPLQFQVPPPKFEIPPRFEVPPPQFNVPPPQFNVPPPLYPQGPSQDMYSQHDDEIPYTNEEYSEHHMNRGTKKEGRHTSQVLQVGNVLQVVPVDLPTVSPCGSQHIQTQSEISNKTSHVVQVGNMLQIVPSTLSQPAITESPVWSTPPRTLSPTIPKASPSITVPKSSPLLPLPKVSPIIPLPKASPTLPPPVAFTPEMESPTRRVGTTPPTNSITPRIIVQSPFILRHGAPAVASLPNVHPGPSAQDSGLALPLDPSMLPAHLLPGLILQHASLFNSESIRSILEFDTQNHAQSPQLLTVENEMYNSETLEDTEDDEAEEQQLIQEAISEVPVDEEEPEDSVTKKAKISIQLKTRVKSKHKSRVHPILPDAGKGILVAAGFVVRRNKDTSKLKSVKFSDGVLPGEGTSGSEVEDLPSPPPPRSRKTKKRLRKKYKVKVAIIRRIAIGEADRTDDDVLAPPPPPPGDPQLIKTPLTLPIMALHNMARPQLVFRPGDGKAQFAWPLPPRLQGITPNPSVFKLASASQTIYTNGPVPGPSRSPVAVQILEKLNEVVNSALSPCTIPPS